MPKKTAWRPVGLKERLPLHNNDDVFNAPSNTDPSVIAIGLRPKRACGQPSTGYQQA